MAFRKPHLALALLSVVLAGLPLAGCEKPDEKEARYMKKGKEYFDQGEFEKARVEYKNAARIKPAEAEPRYRLGLVEEAEGNIRGAFADFMHAEEQDAHYHAATLKLASYYLAGGLADKAQQKLDVVLSDTPDNADAHALQGAILLRQKDFAGTEKEARQALAKDPDNATGYLVLTGLYAEQDDIPKAEATVEESIKHNPKDLGLLLLKARVYNQSHNIPKIAEAYNRLFELKPKEKQFRISMAEIYLRAGQIDDAEKTLRGGVAAMPDDDEMEHQLVAFLGDKRGIDAAEKEIHTYVQINTSERDKYLLWLVDLYMRHDATDRAVALLNQIVDNHGLDSGGLAARTALAHIDYDKGDGETAAKLADAVLGKDPNNLEALYIRGHRAFDQGLYENAVSDMRAILRAQPKTREALALLGEAFVRQGHLDLAIDTFNELTGNEPADTAAKVRLAQLYYMNGDSKRAMDLLFLVTKAEPKNALGWESTARIAIATKDWETAQTSIDTLDALEGQHTMADFLRGQMLAASGKTADAVHYFTQVISADPTAPLAEQALASLVETDRNSGKTEEAAHYIESLKLNTPIANTILGECYITLGRMEDAARVLDAAIAANPPRQEPYLDRAKIYLHNHQTDQALEVLKKGAMAGPADTRAPLLQAEVLGDAGRHEEAVALYEQLLMRNPGLDVAANNLAEIIADYQYADAAALEKARQMAERFSAASNPLLLDTLAWVYYRQGNFQQAQTVMERAMNTGAKLPPQVHYHYGALLLKAGDAGKARAELQQAVADGASYPGSEDAKKLLAGL